MAKQPKSNMKSQMKELRLTEMLKPVFPNLNTLAGIAWTFPISTESIQRSFSQMKLMKTKLHSSLSESSLSHLINIGMGSPDSLADGNLKDIVDVWNRKCRRIPI